MSFEGNFQRLCQNGHESTVDVYDFSDNDICQICKSRFVWMNMVDDTNGDSIGFVSLNDYLLTEGSHSFEIKQIDGKWVTTTCTVHATYSIPPENCHRQGY